MTKEFANEVGLSYTKEKGFVKGVNTRSLPIEDVAWGAFIQIGQWQGKVDITLPLWMTRSSIWASTLSTW